MPTNNRLGGVQSRAGEFAWQGVIDALPDRCNCARDGDSLNSHQMIRVRNDKGIIRFCPVTRKGYIQFHDTGIILDGVFSGNRDGD